MLTVRRRMNRDYSSTQSVYSDARAEYTKQLCVFLVPSYFTFFVDLLEQCKRTQEPRRVLWQFQTLLNEIHDWNMEKVKNEIQTIQNNCGCDYLDDLLTAVCIAHTKVLTAIRLSSNRSKVEITVPKVDHFLFKALCETAKLLWSNTYLFRDGVSSMEKQQNYRAVEGILNEGILQAIRGMVPVKSILKDVMGDQLQGADHADDSDEEAPPIASAAPSTIIEPMVPSDPIPEPIAPIAPIAEPILSPIVPDAPAPTPNMVPVVEEPMPEPVPEPVAAPTEAQPPIIMLDEKPNVRFAPFDAMFNEVTDESDMIDAKDDDATPVLEIMDDQPMSLGAGDFDSLDDGPLGMDADDYEEL